jgi:hypothetical protein
MDQSTATRSSDVSRLRDLYLSTMVRILTNTIYEDGGFRRGRFRKFNPDFRQEGLDWPANAFTMVGTKRLHSLRELCGRVIEADIPGDFIETGIWRGGSCIMMRAILEAYGDKKRKVYCADSFQGVPPSDPENYPKDAGRQLSKERFPQLAITRQTVEDAFCKFDLLDDQVEFLEGWFKDTLPTVRNRTFAVIRLDGDLYESTIQALENLYPALSPDGFCIIDDYGLKMCKAAVKDFRASNKITAPLHRVDKSSVWWQKAPLSVDDKF